jgi:hypothetical protein
MVRRATISRKTGLLRKRLFPLARPSCAVWGGSHTIADQERMRAQAMTAIPISKVPERLAARAGKHVHVNTVWRWCVRGVRGGIRLRSEMIGGTRCTTTEWLDTFIAELNAGGAPVPVAMRTPTQRARASGEALEELARVWHPRPKQGR